MYREQLQPVKLLETYEIERVLRTRRRGGKKQLFVKRKGNPDSFNEWVNEDDMV